MLHISLTPGGMNGPEFDVFAINRNIERRCIVGRENFTKSGDYDSIERPCGLYCLPCSQNKILFVLCCVEECTVLGVVCLHWDHYVLLSMTVTRKADQTAGSSKPIPSQRLRTAYRISHGPRRCWVAHCGEEGRVTYLVFAEKVWSGTFTSRRLISVIGI